MKKRIKFNLLLFTFLVNFTMLSQEKDNNSYLIISFKSNRTKDQHPEKTFHWISPLNSIFKTNDFYPLYFDEFSNEDLKECIDKKEVNIFTISKGENFILDENQIKEIDLLKELVQKNKRKVQTVLKKWNDGVEEKITVYITPIYGKFCFSNIANYSGKEIDYNGNIYLPLSEFKLNSEFFKTSMGKLSLKFDYFINNFKNKI